MQAVYRPKIEKVTQVREAFNAFRAELFLANSPETTLTSSQDICAAMKYEGRQEEFKELMQSVDLDEKLKHPKDLPIFTMDAAKLQTQLRQLEAVPERAKKLKCVGQALRIRGKLRKNLDSKVRYNKHKYMSVKSSTEKADLKPFQDMLLALRFYEPFKYKTGYRLGHPKFQQEFFVLGSQLLTELRDKIHCQCNSGPFFDISETLCTETREPSQPKPIAETPGFFFIHDTFYNDMRDERNQDYSEVIRTWAKKHPAIKQLHSQRMEETKFEDLSFQIGFSQVYQHHGNCEHVFVVSECRLLAATDVLERALYPILNSFSFPRSIPCNVCGHNEANLIIRNSDQHIFDPAYVCQVCAESYHYINGKKQGEFEAYRFVGAQVLSQHDNGETD